MVNVNCYCAMSRRATRALTMTYEAAFADVGVTPAQYELLRTLSHLKGSNGRTLADTMCVDVTTLSRNLKPLLADGWVQSTASAKDGRSMEYRLTRAGRSVLAKCVTRWQKAHEATAAALGKDAGAVMKALERLAAVA